MHSSIKTRIRAGLALAALLAVIAVAPAPCFAGFVPTLKLEQGETTPASQPDAKAEAASDRQADASSHTNSTETSANG